MKRSMIIASTGTASVLSFGASAAVHQVNAEQAQNLQSMGTISVSQVGSAPMDMRHELAAKAEKKAQAATVLLKPVPAIAGTLQLSCTNKPSSSYPTTCPRLSGAFYACPALNRSSPSSSSSASSNSNIKAPKRRRCLSLK